MILVFKLSKSGWGASTKTAGSGGLVVPVDVVVVVTLYLDVVTDVVTDEIVVEDVGVIWTVQIAVVTFALSKTFGDFFQTTWVILNEYIFYRKSFPKVMSPFVHSRHIKPWPVSTQVQPPGHFTFSQLEWDLTASITHLYLDIKIIYIFKLRKRNTS